MADWLSSLDHWQSLVPAPHSQILGNYADYRWIQEHWYVVARPPPPRPLRVAHSVLPVMLLMKKSTQLATRPAHWPPRIRAVLVFIPNPLPRRDGVSFSGFTSSSSKITRGCPRSVGRRSCPLFSSARPSHHITTFNQRSVRPTFVGVRQQGTARRDGPGPGPGRPPQPPGDPRGR